MKEQPIYWIDPYLLRLQTTVKDVWADPDPEVKNGWVIALEATPFYPGGGGQPADKGTISGCVIKSIDNTGSHPRYSITSNSPPKKGDSVECVVEENHRRDYCQQHTGQHLISAVLADKGIKTTSVHMGNAYLGMEVKPVPEIALIKEVSQTCNNLISQNLKVHGQVYTRDELANVKLRSPLKTKTSDSVRIVSIQEIDSVGCGGVHVANTADLKLILFIGSEKIRGTSRLKWLIGERALRQAQNLNERDMELRKIMKTNSESLIAEVEKLYSRNSELASALKANEVDAVKILAESIIKSQSLAEHVQGERKLAGNLIKHLRKSGIKKFFLLVEERETKKLYWLLFDKNEAGNCYADIFENVLLNYQAKGGGKAPQWQGTAIGNAQEIISRIRERII